MRIRNKTNVSASIRRQAFSLVELLAVMAIIVILLSLLAPAIGSFTSTAGRKGAVNILMNTLEQARSAALESGANVYVVFWRRQFPDQDSVIVLREVTDWQKDAALAGAAMGINPSANYVPLTRYTLMPKGILLYDGRGKNIFKDTPLPGDLLAALPAVKGQSPAASDIGYVQFSPTGSIPHPSDKDSSRVVITEGVRGTNGTEAIIAATKQKQGGFEIITFRRFTGRASVDVTTLD